MTDPVLCTDGHTYERDAITNWLQVNSTSPMTRQALYTTQVTPNIALRNIIRDYLAAQQSPSNASASASSTSSASSASSTSSSLFTPLPIETTAIYYPHVNKLHVRSMPPVTGHRQPITLFALIDNSGSMGEPAGMSDSTESHGFSRLDLVKHGVNTLANLLNEHDTLAIISFSTAARVVMPPSPMNTAGRTKVTSALQTIYPDGQTNIWDAIRIAAQLANRPEMAGRNLVGMLLTDGFPNVNPPRGIVSTIKSMPMTNPWTFHTFGFGYNLDSKLLQDISEWGNGLFGFIPDCSMVGTVFVNFLANMLTTAVPNMEIRVNTRDTGHIAFQTGPLCLDQPRDFVLEPSSPPSSYSIGNEVTERTVTVVEAALDPFVAAYADYMKAIDDAIRTKTIEPLLRFHTAYAAQSDQKIKDLLRDVQSPNESEGQVGMALSYFQRWGEHYLRSYRTAQKLQVAMNFKDPGLQIYGGDLFHAIQGDGDRIFCDLPAPIPSRATPTQMLSQTQTLSQTPTHHSTYSASPISMAVFHNQSGGCFVGSSLIRMSDMSLKQIRYIRPGDNLWCPTTNSATNVIALVECNSYAQTQLMTQLGSLCITPWHPIRLNSGEWKFPADLTSPAPYQLNKVFNLVLDTGHTVEAEGVICCTLAHGFQEDKVKHDYFGTSAVIHDLTRLPGWSMGFPTFRNLVAIRDPTTNLVNGWIDQP